MAFRQPNFNLLCNIWRNGTDNANPPDLADQPCALVNGRSGGFWVSGLYGTTVGQVQASIGRMQQTVSLLLPKLTDIRAAYQTAANWGDLVEVPAGSGRYYWVPWMDDVGKGHSNEHREAALLQWTNVYQAFVTGAWTLGASGGWPAPVP
jgi:hypothetical protein